MAQRCAKPQQRQHENRLGGSLTVLNMGGDRATQVRRNQQQANRARRPHQEKQQHSQLGGSTPHKHKAAEKDQDIAQHSPALADWPIVRLQFISPYCCLSYWAVSTSSRCHERMVRPDEVGIVAHREVIPLGNNQLSIVRKKSFPRAGIPVGRCIHRIS